MFHRWRADRDASPHGSGRPERQNVKAARLTPRGQVVLRRIDRCSVVAIGAMIVAMLCDAPSLVVACLMFLSTLGMLGAVFVKAFYDPRGGDKKEES